MPILPNRIYSGMIQLARLDRLEKTDGSVTRSIKVRVLVPNEGTIDHHLYLTAAAANQTKKVLSELNSEIWEGTYPFLLRDPAPYLVQRPCKIETELHVFENKNGIREQSVRVKWLNGVNEGKPGDESDVLAVLGIFGIADNPDALKPADEQPAA